MLTTTKVFECKLHLSECIYPWYYRFICVSDLIIKDIEYLILMIEKIDISSTNWKSHILLLDVNILQLFFFIDNILLSMDFSFFSGHWFSIIGYIYIFLIGSKNMLFPCYLTFSIRFARVSTSDKNHSYVNTLMLTIRISLLFFGGV